MSLPESAMPTPVISDAGKQESVRQDFIRQIVRDDLAGDRQRSVRTRLPPEPYGNLLIGQATAICWHVGVAAAFGCDCILRVDDTNMPREDPEYVRAIQEGVPWLGFDWHALRHASDYFK